MPTQDHEEETSGKRNTSSASVEQAKSYLKKRKLESTCHLDDSQDVINRRFYPSEISRERCEKYRTGEILRPFNALQAVLDKTREQRDSIYIGRAVIYWFKRDIRTHDNTALFLASQKASEAQVPLVGLFLLCSQDLLAHSTSPCRVDFILRSLLVLRDELHKLNIPLQVEIVNKRNLVATRILEFCQSLGAQHLYSCLDYEVDELRRDVRIVHQGLEAEIPIAYYPQPGTCVVSPGELKSGSGNQYSVYSPWFRAWIAYLQAHESRLALSDYPVPNPERVRESLKVIFQSKIPEAPAERFLDDKDREKFQRLWPAGEREAHARLQKFLSEKIEAYADGRNNLSANATSMLSAHLAAGTLSPRTAVVWARNANTTKQLDGGKVGITSWISEIAWRDFYKHVMVQWPYICMSKPFKTEYAGMRWESNQKALQAWKDGMTGYPIVDAAMRQLKYMGYMHNRARMIVASFLSKQYAICSDRRNHQINYRSLLLDWRLGEKFFMENLIDFASNNGGWGFSTSTGVDPQPYFRIFNPLLQSEKFDSNGTYIRKWVPELNELDSNKIHDPWGRGGNAVAERLGYPKPIIDHKYARDRALARYKECSQRSVA